MWGRLSARGGLITRRVNARKRPDERRFRTGAQDIILPHMAPYFASIDNYHFLPAALEAGRCHTSFHMPGYLKS